MTDQGIGQDEPGSARYFGGRAQASADRRVRASVPERIALAVMGSSIAVLGLDSALEAQDGFELAWWAVGLLGLVILVAAVRGTAQPMRRIARALRLPPMA